MSQTGNLEKLGILVIVILVVVVGVVALTPKPQVDTALYGPESGIPPQPLDPLAAPGDAESADPNAWPLGAPPLDLPVAVPAPAEGAPTDAMSGAAPATQTAGAPGAVGPAQASPLSSSTTPAAPALASAAPQLRDYVIRKGDTPASIARDQLGRASLAQSILDANPGLDARRLKIGQTIRIPGAPAAPAPGTQSPERTTATLPPSVPPAAGTPSRTGSEYVVQAGDTLSDIARRELGSSSKWRQIVEANESVLHGSDVVRVGMKLRIPARGGSSTPAVAASAPRSGDSSSRTYLVQAGDTLSSIASRMLGSGSRWREIQAANESVLHGSDRLVVGMQLTIPQDVNAR